jgi:acetate---CoA ligase (ADP-forming)
MHPSLDAVFKPKSIAVIGASRKVGTIGHTIVANLLNHGFEGVVYPVNPGAPSVHSIPAYPSISEVPGNVDLAIIVVPKQLVLDVVRDCGEKGVKGLVVITAGFKEVGGEGIAREAALLELVREHGMRLVGPNCMGILNSDPDVSMNATFAPTMPPTGGTAFLSQSGALGVTILDYATELGIGVHQFVSVGNKPDVSGNDVLEYWEDDASVRVVLMYLESFGNPRRFTRIARRVTKKKPIVVVKSGRTSAGARAASSHTGAMASGDSATEALFSQCGIIRADSIQDLFDYARAFEDLPIPQGNRVAIVTNAGGPGIMIADACEEVGLAVSNLSMETTRKLASEFPEEASVRNPVDMIASANDASYHFALDAVLSDPNVDAAIASFVPPLGVKQLDIAKKIRMAAEAHPMKPVLAVLMGREGFDEGRAHLQEAGVPTYLFPESATRALSGLVRYGRWLERPIEEPRVYEDVDKKRAQAILDGVVADGRSRLLEPEALDLLDAYGIGTVPHSIASNAEEAALAGEKIGFPVVVKAVSPDIVHKSDVGAVRVDLRTAEELAAAVSDIQASVAEKAPESRIDGFLVAKHVAGGKEIILGMTTDPSFGPVPMFGLGGIYVEALGDVAFGVHPLTETDAREMIQSIRGHAILEGIRGDAPTDTEAIAEALQRMSQLAGEHPRIQELDMNPCLAFEKGLVAVDARLTLQ